MAPVLVTGATGNVGSAVLRCLTANGVAARVAGRPGRAEDHLPDNVVALDFTDPSTWSAAFDGVESMFLMRPPAIGNVRRDLLPPSRPLGTLAYATSCSCRFGRRSTRAICLWSSPSISERSQPLFRTRHLARQEPTTADLLARDAEEERPWTFSPWV